MKKFYVLLFLLLVSGLGFSQTTVTLEDQCNCEVLSGTDVSAAGAITPSGADIGDIYVNTNTGTIYFWDGDSWERTSTDTNTTNVTLAVVGTDLVLTDSDGNSVSLPIADIGALTDTDDQTAAEVSFDNTTSGLAATNVQQAIDEINAAAGTVSLTDNGNGTYDFTDASGTTTTIADTSVSTLVDNGDGTYTYTDELGVSQTIDTNASSNPYDNTTSGLAASNVQAAVDELATNAAADTDQVVGNEYNTNVLVNAGAVEVTDGGGTLSADLISTDLNNDIVAGTDGALYLNVASVTISETITNLTDNGDGTLTYVNESGASQTVNKSDITDNADGTYTFTNNDGSDVILDTRAASNFYDDTTSGLGVANVQDAIDALSFGSTDDQALSLSGNTLTLEDGGTVDLTPYLDNTDDQQITDFSLSGNIVTLTLEDGGTQTIDLSGFVSTDDQDLTGATLTG
ncbi:MAG: hypothetical protein WBV75_08700, partial [Robiginitalea sp.]